MKEITDLESLPWHSAVLPWVKDDIGKVKLFLLFSSMCLISDFFVPIVCWKFFIELQDCHKGIFIMGHCQVHCSLEETIVENSCYFVDMAPACFY